MRRGNDGGCEVSSDRGRSWRPEKKVTARQSRRKQIIVLLALLVVLAGAAGCLILWPKVPTAHFIVVSEEKFSADSTTITPLPPGSTAVNAQRLLKAANRLHELDSSKVNEPEKRVSVSALVDTPPDAENKFLVVYVTTAATIAPLDTDDSKICVQLLSADAGKKPIPFKKLLTSLRQSGAKRTLLLLELTGRHPGLASGVLADDLPSLLKSELRAENVPGLTFICACSQGERSWEFFQDKPASMTDPSKAPEKGTPVATAATLPEFDGTVFGHFLIKAMEEGEAENAATLFGYLEQKVKDWVGRHYKSSQTVWLVASDDKSMQNKLLSSIRLPKIADEKKNDDAQAEAKTSESKPQQGDDSGTETASGAADPGTSTSRNDVRPVALLQQRTRERDLLAAGTTPARYPAKWLRLQMHMVAAERFAMNGNQDEFERIHDEELGKSLTDLTGIQDRSDVKTSDEQKAIHEWLLLSRDAADSAVQFSQLIQDFGIELEKTPPLPKELQSPGGARQTFAIEFGKELLSLRKAIDTMPQPDRLKRIQQLARLLENIAEKGWRLNQFPESMATVKLVLQTWEQDPNALRLKPLVRLMVSRESALQLAAGLGSDRLPLRRKTWNDCQVPEQINRILVSLNSVERWLCTGPDAIELANDELEKAEGELATLQNKVNLAQTLSRVHDAQRLELPFLIEYLALRLESTSLSSDELQAAGRMAESALAGSPGLDEFPTGPLKPIEFRREHLDAMFALTRAYSSTNPVTKADERHLNTLREYVNSRSRKTLPASERLQLLKIPQFPERSNVVAQLQPQLTSEAEDTKAESSHSGIWLGFWSLRLADAITGQTHNADWQAWSTLVSAINPKNDTDLPAIRTKMAITLQKRWTAVLEKLEADSAEDVFVPQAEVLDLFSREASRRARTSGNNELFASILQTTKAVESASDATKVEAPSELTPLADGSYELSLKVQNVSAVYLLNKDFNVLNANESRHNWSVISVSPISGIENAVILRLQPKSILASPVPVKLIFVNPDGAAVESQEIVVQPSAENEWSIQVVRVKEEDTTEQTVDTPPGKSHSAYILPLPPSTMDMPVLLKVRLRRDKGVASKVRVQIRPVQRQRAAWATMELSFPPGESEVIVPMVPPPSVGDASAAAPAAAAPEIDITEGVLFEITPLNLNEDVTSRLTLDPSLLAADDIFLTPIPVYDHSAQKLTLRLNQQDFNNSSRIWPSQFPGELVLSPALSKFQKPGGALKTLNASTFEFLTHFQPEVENAIGRVPPLEFGISLVGIPHAWWWRLDETMTPKPITNEIRSFLHVENEQEVKVVAKAPELLIGEGSRKASFRSEIFLHGIQFDQEQQLNVRISSSGSDGSTPATDRPVSVNSQFAESVTVAPGAGGVWKVTTKTSPYTIPIFTPDTFQLAEGRHELIASLRTNDLSVESKESSVYFTLDESPPTLNENSIEIKQSPVLVTGSLKGKITVTDPESGITRIRVGLKEESMQDLKLKPDTKIIEEFELNSLDFPKIEQKESDNTESGTLIVEVTNGVGLSTKKTKRIAFVRRGKAIAMKEEPKKPGSIKVTFSIAAEFTVSVSGPDGYMDEKSGMSPVVFEDVPEGVCSVRWKPKQGTAGSGANSSVMVRSGRMTPVKGN